MRPRFVVFALCAGVACDQAPAPYTWAFSAEMDGRVPRRERCRETLAEIIDRPGAPVRREEEPGTYTYISREPYRIHAIRDAESCEHARMLVSAREAESVTLFYARGSGTAPRRIAAFDRGDSAVRCETCQHQ